MFVFLGFFFSCVPVLAASLTKIVQYALGYLAQIHCTFLCTLDLPVYIGLG